jgi:hypothetical protein
MKEKTRAPKGSLIVFFVFSVLAISGQTKDSNLKFCISKPPLFVFLFAPWGVQKAKKN